MPSPPPPLPPNIHVGIDFLRKRAGTVIKVVCSSDSYLRPSFYMERTLELTGQQGPKQCLLPLSILGSI